MVAESLTEFFKSIREETAGQLYFSYIIGTDMYSETLQKQASKTRY